MVDQNDSFIREVNEELRSDQVRNAWKRYSRVIIGVAVVIVLGTAGHRLNGRRKAAFLFPATRCAGRWRRAHRPGPRHSLRPGRFFF